MVQALSNIELVMRGGQGGGGLNDYVATLYSGTKGEEVCPGGPGLMI